MSEQELFFTLLDGFTGLLSGKAFYTAVHGTVADEMLSPVWLALFSVCTPVTAWLLGSWGYLVAAIVGFVVYMIYKARPAKTK